MPMISSGKSLFKTYQGQYEDLVDFRKRFTAAAEVQDHIDAYISKFSKGVANKIIKKAHGVDLTSATTTQIEAAEKRPRP